jgi:hypothetical protein
MSPTPPSGKIDPRTVERLAKALADALEARLAARRKHDRLRKDT